VTGALVVIDALAALGNSLVAQMAATAPPAVIESSRSLWALLYIRNGGTARPGELGDHIAMSSGGVTKLLDRLEHLGYLSRRYCLAEDRRGVEVALTATGTSLVDSLVEGLASQSEDIVDVMQLIIDHVHSG
jgi:DNA-binding MarR family transcriptional regulator